MIYDEEKGLLITDVKEAVATARRGMSAYTGSDDEEPDISDSALCRANKKGSFIELTREYEHSGYNFLIRGRALSYENDTLEVLFTVPTAREIKKKETEKQARGEAFMLGAMALERGGSAEDVLKLRTTFLAEDTRETTLTEESVTRSKLYAFFDKCVESLAKTGRAEIERVTER